MTNLPRDLVHLSIREIKWMVYRNILLCRVFSFLRSKLERKIDCYTLGGDQILRKPPELCSILIEKYASLLKLTCTVSHILYPRFV